MTYEPCGAACHCEDPCGRVPEELVWQELVVSSEEFDFAASLLDEYDPEYPGPCMDCAKPDFGCKWGECSFMLDKDALHA